MEHTDNKRKQERFSLGLETKVIHSDLGDGGITETMTANISAGGVFLETDDPLPLASKVQLEFLLAINDLKKLRFVLSLASLRSVQNNQVWVQAQGVVIRTEKSGMAIIFDENYQILPMVPGKNS